MYEYLPIPPKAIHENLESADRNGIWLKPKQNEKMFIFVMNKNAFQ